MEALLSTSAKSASTSSSRIANRSTISELTDHLEKSAGNPNRTEAIRRAHITLDPYLRFITELNPYQPFPDAPRCAAPDDRKFIELAYASQADCLVTEDGKLLILNSRTIFPMGIIYLFTHWLGTRSDCRRFPDRLCKQVYNSLSNTQSPRLQVAPRPNPLTPRQISGPPTDMNFDHVPFRCQLSAVIAAGLTIKDNPSL